MQELRPVTAEEFEAMHAVLDEAFGGDLHPEDLALARRTFEYDRSLAAFVDGRVVASSGIYSLDMTVPGAVVPTAGVTYIGVLPTHRRRGILGSIMQRQLEQARDRGEPIAALWASESAIYGRFGYGMASQRLSVRLQRGHGGLRPGVAGEGADGRLTLVRSQDPRAEMEEVFRAAGTRRPGSFARDERWWDVLLADPERSRRGWSALRCVGAHADDGPAGYATYRTKGGWDDDSLPDLRLNVVELVAATPVARAALWRYLLGIDLVTEIRADNLPADEPLLHLLTDPRRARGRLGDNLWVRIVDVAEALGARRYSAPLDVVIDVTDDRCPWNAGRFRLEADGDRATCQRTGDPASAAGVSLGVDALGAAYLGGTRLAALAQAGRVTERVPGTVSRLSTAFGTDPLPHCPTMF